MEGNGVKGMMEGRKEGWMDGWMDGVQAMLPIAPITL
jgi:hypothetical protein